MLFEEGVQLLFIVAELFPARFNAFCNFWQVFFSKFESINLGSDVTPPKNEASSESCTENQNLPSISPV